jgi:protein-S-isoprenylcysteine O-methyltransferase Ste14
MKEKAIWSGLVFLGLFLLGYFPMFADHEAPEILRIVFSVLIAFVGAAVSWCMVNSDG